jgi:hypothetical protein
VNREEALASPDPSTGGRRRVSDWKETLLLPPARQALGSANAGDGRCDRDDRIGNDAYCRKDDGAGRGGVHSVESADAGADVALDDAPEVDAALERRSRLRHDCC